MFETYWTPLDYGKTSLCIFFENTFVKMPQKCYIRHILVDILVYRPKCVSNEIFASFSQICSRGTCSEKVFSWSRGVKYVSKKSQGLQTTISDHPGHILDLCKRYKRDLGSDGGIPPPKKKTHTC